MAIEIRVPRLGWSMDEGTFMGWLKRAGEVVAPGDPLFELEGEKASQEIEAVDGGILYIPEGAPDHGTTVPVGGLLGYLLAPGEASPFSSTASTPPIAQPSSRESSSVTSTAEPCYAPAHLSKPANQPIATPRARRLAAERGLDWRTLTGSGRNGRIRERDLPSTTDSRLPWTSVSDVSNRMGQLTGRRKAIAERMRQSHARVVPVTLTSTVDMSRFLDYRSTWKIERPSQPAPSATTLCLWSSAKALLEHPMLGARWISDDRWLLPDSSSFGIGVAVDTVAGLIVPVIRDPHRLDFAALHGTCRSLIERARSNQIQQSDLEDSIFSISNLGAFGVESFTPIVPYPQVAILGIGAVRNERMTLCLTFDHVAVDGAPAAKFLQCIGHWIEGFAIAQP